jgi:hypothetical protein
MVAMNTKDAAAQQIDVAARRMVPQIYRAVMAQPTPALRAQVMRMILVGVDPGLSDRVAGTVEALEAKGVEPKRAVLQALSTEMSIHMHELLAGMEGLGTTTTTSSTTSTSRQIPMSEAVRAQRADNAARIINSTSRAIDRLANTAGNIAISAVQARTQQTVTGLPGVMPAAQPAALPPLGPMDLSPYGQTVQGPVTGGTPWGWIVGGVAVVGGLGALWYFTQKKPAAAAA